MAVGAFGLSFGVLAAEAGLGLPEAAALSSLVFAGSTQLAAVGVIAEGGTAAAAVLSGLLLAARSVAFGVALAPVLRGPLRTRLLASHLLIDESAALAAAQRGRREARRAFAAAGVAVFLLWNAGTVLGWLLTDAIDVATVGLDAAIPAAFVALLAPRLERPAARAAALAGAAIALALTPITAAGVPILLASLGALAGLAAERRARRAAR
ncbi:AzlC family ABC transporter permease [Miltoncostaea marina]|uniref:AzlC family ABC transporter permease n=1 Tax=Miltoncostaea marina TaxID=2843215 RepID=UPI001C3E066A|nr:AzlC family ABC transporter permease [Miltoncostaea marina]